VRKRARGKRRSRFKKNLRGTYELKLKATDREAKTSGCHIASAWMNQGLEGGFDKMKRSRLIAACKTGDYWGGKGKGDG